MCAEPLAEELPAGADAWDACRRLAGLPHLLFLDSADRSSPLGRYSYVTADPFYALTRFASLRKADVPVHMLEGLLNSNRLQVERATDGFVLTHLRHVVQDGNDRTLRLTSRYRPSRNVVLVGTGGKPAGPSQVIPNRPTSGGGTDTSTRTTTPAPSTSGTPAAKPTTAPATPAPAAKPSNTQPVPASKPSNTQPAPASKPIISPLFPGGNTTSTRPG